MPRVRAEHKAGHAQQGAPEPRGGVTPLALSPPWQSSRGLGLKWAECCHPAPGVASRKALPAPPSPSQ